MNQAHYPSLKLCRELTKIGFSMTEKIKLFCGDSGYKDAMYNKEIHSNKYDYVCPSVMEMLDVMPIYIMEDRYVLSIHFMITWEVGYIPMHSEEYGLKSFDRDSLPNALAEMIIWLAENNYISFNK